MTKTVVRYLVASEMSKVVGAQGANLTLTIFESAGQTHIGGLATGLSLLVMVYAASMLFVRLKQAINALWGIAPHPEKGWVVRLRTHFLSILMVLMIGLILLVSMTVSTFLVFVNHYLATVPQLAQVFQKLARSRLLDRFPALRHPVHHRLQDPAGCADRLARRLAGRRRHRADLHPGRVCDRLLPGAHEPRRRIRRCQLGDRHPDLGLLLHAAHPAGRQVHRGLLEPLRLARPALRQSGQDHPRLEDNSKIL